MAINQLSRVAFGLLTCIVATLAGAEHANSTITVSDGWIREAPPGAMALAGYLTLENAGSVDRALVDVRSEVFAAIELHRTVLEGGIARMRAQDAIPVPAHGNTVLRPGDYHLMLMHPRAPLRAGDSVPLILVFDNGEELSVTVQVRGRPDD